MRGVSSKIFCVTVLLAVSALLQAQTFGEGHWFRPENVREHTASSASDAGDAVADMALQYIGYPYVWATAGPDTFDCSGLTYFLYKQAGHPIPRIAYDQYEAGEPIYFPSDLRKGDLIFFNNSQKAFGHAAIVVDVNVETGEFIFVHASSPKVGVIITSSEQQFYKDRWIGGCRIFPDQY